MTVPHNHLPSELAYVFHPTPPCAVSADLGPSVPHPVHAVTWIAHVVSMLLTCPTI